MSSCAVGQAGAGFFGGYYYCISLYVLLFLLATSCYKKRKTRRKDRKNGALRTSFGMPLPAFGIANYVGIDKGGRSKR